MQRMKTIYKYRLDLESALFMPKDAQVLSIQMQDGFVCLWALVDTDNEKEMRIFMCYGTGMKIADSAYPMDFLGTVQADSGSLVLHVFEIKRNIASTQ
jgi:hypothetical protein